MACQQHGSAMMHKVLKKFHALAIGVKDEGGEGIPNWHLSPMTISLMREFRESVISKNEDKVQEFITLLINDNENEPIVDQLTELVCDRSSPEPTKEALLTAILVGNRPLVEFILQLFAEFPHEEKAGCSKSHGFPPYMTPLMLACLCNNYAIVECLLLRDHRLIHPHMPDCICESCCRLSHSINGRHQRLDTYRAITSEAYLWLGTHDPLLACLDISEDLERCKQCDNQHAEVYSQLISKVQTFSGDFIQQCRTVEEVDCILDQREGVAIADCETLFPRARLALDARMTPMLSHMNVQIALRARWLGSWAEGEGNFWRRFGRFTRHTILYPILALLHAFSAGLMVKSFDIPYARFISYTTSYFIFVFLLGLHQYLRRTDSGASAVELFIEIYAFIYICGQVVCEFLEFSRRGMKKYFGLWWRFFDFIMLFVFVVAFVCWIASKTYNDYTHLPRKHWVPYAPQILFEIFFGASSLMAFWRVFYFIQLHRNFGSTVISIGRCVGQVFNYFIIMGIVITSFAMGISTILQPYNDAVETNSNGYKTMSSSFADIFFSIRSLFWGFFGYLHYSEYGTVTGNAGPNQEPSNHYATSAASEFLVAIYYVVTVITLLNLMISLLVKKADEVLENEDVEWKYTRAHIYFEFFEESAAVPPPFNLIYLVAIFLKKICSTDYKLVWPDLYLRRDLLSDVLVPLVDHNYQKILISIFRRYHTTKFLHYRTIQNVDADTKLKKESRAIMSFLNEPKNSIFQKRDQVPIHL